MIEKRNKNFLLSTSPHIHKGVTTSEVMRGVVLGLVPAIGTSLYFFRFHALYLLATCVSTSLFCEVVTQRLSGKKITLNDGSALVTGVLMALILPPTFPLFAAVLGTAFAIIIGKHIFGGLGYNIFNPALLGRAFLVATYPVLMTTWTSPIGYEATTSATPLAAAKFDNIITSLDKLLLGNIAGSLGETSALVLLIGGVWLILKRYADWRVPVGMLSTVAIIGGIIWLFNPSGYPSPLFHLLSGGLLLGAFFMATDPVTSPVTKRGRWIFGIGAGVLVVVIRIWGGYPEGVMYSILLMNAATPLLNRYTVPVQFGG